MDYARKCFLMVLLFLCAARYGFAEQPEQIRNAIDSSTKTRQQTLKGPADGQAQKERLKLKYYELKEGMRGTATDIERMKDIIAKQEQYISATNNKIIELERMRQDLVLYLTEVLNRMEVHVNKDLPFSRDERIKTIADLKDLVVDTKVGMGEKLRRVLEGLKTEMEYGNTVENSMDEIQYQGQKLQVHVYRLGRIAMFMRTIDDKETAIYNGKEWEPMTKEYGAEIKKAMENAKRSKSGEFVNLPLPGVAQ